MDVAVVVLAAGEGTRMRSAQPKVLHPVGGAPMLAHVLRAGSALAPRRKVVVTGHGRAQVEAALARWDSEARIAHQEVARGTADAVAAALPLLEDFRGAVLILYGDTPLVRPETLARAVRTLDDGAALAVLGFEAAEPRGYGRLVTGPEGLERIVEDADASDEERAIRLCNSGIMAVEAEVLRQLLPRVGNDNAKGEFYLTDLVALAREEGLPARVVPCGEEETRGVNSRAELAAAEAAFQARARAEAMARGATLIAPETVFLSHDTRLAQDVTVHPHVVFGPGVEVAEGAEIRAFSHLEGVRIGAGASIGPFARIRPGSEIGQGARVGNFVEVKNAVLAPGAKAGHLSYLGDARIGSEANIGAGTITCNYDGVSKHRTEIGARAFIGSNSALVAPVTVGAEALVAAGSTITEDVPEGALAVARARQLTRPGLARRLMDRLRALAGGSRH